MLVITCNDSYQPLCGGVRGKLLNHGGATQYVCREKERSLELEELWSLVLRSKYCVNDEWSKEQVSLVECGTSTREPNGGYCESLVVRSCFA